MRTRDIFRKGIRLIAQNWKYVFLFWFTNAAFAFVMSFSIYHLLIDHLEFSLMSGRIAEGFQNIWLLQFLSNYSKSIGQISITIYGVVGIYVIVQTFYSGGMISIFNNPKKNHMVDFFYGGVNLFARYILVTFLSLCVFAAAFYLNDQVGYLIRHSFINPDMELTDFLLRSIRYALMLFFIVVFSLITDYAKVLICVENGSKALKEIMRTLIFLKNNFKRVFFIFITISFLGMGIAFIYNIIGKFIPRTPSYFLILAFFLQQLLIILRLFVRMLFYSTEVTIFKDIDAEVLTVKVHEFEKEF